MSFVFKRGVGGKITHFSRDPSVKSWRKPCNTSFIPKNFPTVLSGSVATLASSRHYLASDIIYVSESRKKKR